MDIKKTVEQYLNEISSSSPTPGGGNVSAFCGALASSLGIMVCNLTIGKKKYDDVQEEIEEAKEKLLTYQKNFLILAEKDNEAFNRVMNAFKLPKENEEQAETRKKAIQDATLEAAAIPMEVLKNCSAVFIHIKTAAEKGNKNSISDAGVAATLIGAAANGAYLNILINVSSLENKTIAREILKSADALIDDIDHNVKLITKIIKDSLSQ
ncbi:glutamate formimidoyltransferase [Melioribacter roseus P3M-2]|uniref:Glutamate formimidoyltransferase n=1 Tax=Melioribacter roseus (strain DSM 23840 / JCM 17771 / VKM B-2668 / P3M-2) TaxID=1191523 RepID=I6Z2C2_MELRP|nr:cyclodeaminase/cyclohydrolase family protein [Melioribacter roseus]AFN73300.1 glutamate formimidoyltransferase [Melioribacter roseus P3M-2]